MPEISGKKTVIGQTCSSAAWATYVIKTEIYDPHVYIITSLTS